MGQCPKISDGTFRQKMANSNAILGSTLSTWKDAPGAGASKAIQHEAIRTFFKLHTASSKDDQLQIIQMVHHKTAAISK